MLVIKGSESIGWRLATQESTTSFLFTKETEFSPSVLPRKAESNGEYSIRNQTNVFILICYRCSLLSFNTRLYPIFLGSKYISKSEDNLLTPQCDSSAHQTSWTEGTPLGAQIFRGRSFTDSPVNLCLKNTYVSEPAIVISKPPSGTGLPKKLCCASSAESLENERSITEPQSQTGANTLATTWSAGELQAVALDFHSSTDLTEPSKSPSVDREPSSFPSQQSLLGNKHNTTFDQIEVAALSPLHIDSVLFESSLYCSPVAKATKDCASNAAISSHNSSMVGDGDKEAEQVNCSRLIDALDIQSPAHFKLGVSPRLQFTPYNLGLEHGDELGTPPRLGTTVCVVDEKDEFSPQIATKGQRQQPLSPNSLETQKRRVADHIQHFNKLTLHSPRGTKANQIKSPLKFHRTPVRQTVRRINSLLGENRRPTRNADPSSSQSIQVIKAVSLESGLSPHPLLQLYPGEPQVERTNSMCPRKKPPPVPPKKPSTLACKPKVCALGDVTNMVQPKTKADSFPDPSGAQKPLLQQVAEKNMNYYRGSPRNPLNQGRLLSATKPVDL